MSTARQIHKEAMAKVKLANEALKGNDPFAYENMLADALQLEKEAAYLLANEYDSEPTRSVLFRSAASIANNLGEYADAIELIKTALKGNPHYEVREELLELLDEVNEKVMDEYPAIKQEMDSSGIYPMPISDGFIITANTLILANVSDGQLSQLHEPTHLPILNNQMLGLLRLNEYFKKSFKEYMGWALAGEATVQKSINSYVQSKHKLLSRAIGKPDTQAIWYSVSFLFHLYDEMTYLNADGVRFYFGAYEESHAAYSLQTCLMMVPTRRPPDDLSKHTVKLEHVNVMLEGEPDFIDRSFPGAKRSLPPSYIAVDLLKQRVNNYSNSHLPLLSETIGKEDTKSLWYSKSFLESMLKGLAYFNANGVRICLGSIESELDFGRTTLIVVPTRLQEDGAIHVLHDEGGFVAFAQTDSMRAIGAVLECEGVDIA
jgi:tetratricopeptide (TPR) repeat protein